MASQKWRWKVVKDGSRWLVRGGYGADKSYGSGRGPFLHKSDAKATAAEMNRQRNPRKRATSRKRKNPVRVAASMAGKSTGWMPAKAVRVVKGKGGQVRVDVKR